MSPFCWSYLKNQEAFVIQINTVAFKQFLDIRVSACVSVNEVFVAIVPVSCPTDNQFFRSVAVLVSRNYPEVDFNRAGFQVHHSFGIVN